MAVTTAQLGRHSMRGFQAGELAGNRQGKPNSRRPLRRSFPNCSFDGYYNLISSHHVKAAPRRRLDSARISVQVLNLQTQGLVCITQSLDIRLHADVLL